MDDRRISYAQNREDIILEAFFPDVKKGFYIDVGASHPVVSSVTKLFYEKGWHGINIEPSPKYYKLLVEDRPRDTNLNIGLGAKEETLRFREYRGYGLSTFSQDMQEAYEHERADDLTASYVDHEIPVRTLKQVLGDTDVEHIHFMKVDVEGFEYQVLAGNDWKKYRPEIICIESNHIIKDWRPLLQKERYEKCFFDGLNDYYVAAESKQRAEAFSYPEAVLLGKPVIVLQWHQELGRQEKKNYMEQQANLSKQRELERTISLLQAQLVENSRTRNQIKMLGRKVDSILEVHIAKLDKPRRRRVAKPASLHLPASQTGSRAELLSLARLNDLNSFYTTSGSGKYHHSYSYLAAHSLHSGMRATARKSKAVVRLLGKRKTAKGKRHA